jgi:hypothetical protein
VSATLSLDRDQLFQIAERMSPAFRDRHPDSEILSALDEVYAHKGHEAETGSVDDYEAHYYLVDRWVVSTDRSGWKEYREFDTTQEAYAHFGAMDDMFQAWRESGRAA